MAPIIAQGFAYDPATRDWTALVQYEARDRLEAVRWINFNRDWLRGPCIVPDGTKPTAAIGGKTHA